MPHPYTCTTTHHCNAHECQALSVGEVPKAPMPNANSDSGQWGPQGRAGKGLGGAPTANVVKGQDGDTNMGNAVLEGGGPGKVQPQGGKWGGWAGEKTLVGVGLSAREGGAGFTTEVKSCA